MLSSDDVTFLAKHTKLSKKKVKLLTEEPRDLALVLDAITTAKITKDEIISLSFDIVIKYVVFRFSHHFDYSISEKLYISEVLSKHFPYISRSEIFKPVSKHLTRDLAEYSFVLLGLFKHRLTPKQSIQYEGALKYFRDSEHSDLYSHLAEWFEICNKIKTQEVFV